MANTDFPNPPAWVAAALREGLVIPAHPLALDDGRKLDERRQQALTRYYHAAGAGGLAVGVHTTQFEIRRGEHNLLRPVLELAIETARRCDRATGRSTVCIAGICGPTQQAVAEGVLARELGYHAGLVSLADLPDAGVDTLVAHCRRVARELPIMGFYLQPAAGGRLLEVAFWRRLLDIPNVVAIKVAAFNRYHTLDVVRALSESGRAGEIALYTGNDDHIVLDLLAQFRFESQDGSDVLRFSGGLLGHWACTAGCAARLLPRIQRLRGAPLVPVDLLTIAEQMTDQNAAVFDAAHGFAGCLAGISEVLRRQGLLNNAHCLDPSACLSPGQAEELTRVHNAYPHLHDDVFIAEHRDAWLGA